MSHILRERSLEKDKPSIIFGQNLHALNQQPDRLLFLLTSMNTYPLQPTGLEVTDTLLSSDYGRDKQQSLGPSTMIVARRSGGQPHGISVPGPTDL